MVLADVLAIVGMHECIWNCMFFYVVDSVMHNALVRDVSFKIITWWPSSLLMQPTSNCRLYQCRINLRVEEEVYGLKCHQFWSWVGPIHY